MSDPRSLLKKAEDKAASARGGFSFFGGKQEKLEAAAEMFVQAANAFRVQNQLKEGAAAYERAADIQREIGEPDDAANSFVEAYKSYKRGDDPLSAARVLKEAIGHYTSKGNFRRAATYQQNLAELYELDLGDNKQACEAYQLAGDWFLGDNAEALANKVFLKVADLAALDANYELAVKNYEMVAKASAHNNLMRYSIKDYFLKAGICYLAQKDLVAAKRAIEGYLELDPTFKSTREFLLLTDIIDAVEKGEEEEFSDKVFKYDQMSQLDKWKTTMLLRVKETIEEEDFA